MSWMFLPFRRFAQFRGRSRRKEYWMFILFLTIVYSLFVGVAVAMGVSAATGGPGSSSVLGMMGSLGALAIFVGLFWLVTLIPSIAVAVRRLHDTDRSGWWLMLYIGPYVLSLVLNFAGIANGSASLQLASVAVSAVGFVGALVLLVFMCLDGTRGLNRYGPDPKQLSDGETLSDVFA